jgi:hypothetical protein
MPQIPSLPYPSRCQFIARLASASITCDRPVMENIENRKKLYYLVWFSREQLLNQKRLEQINPYENDCE